MTETLWITTTLFGVLAATFAALYFATDDKLTDCERALSLSNLRADHLADKVARLEAATLPDVTWFDRLSARREHDRLVLDAMGEDVSWGGDAS